MTKDPQHRKKNLYKTMQLKPNAKFADVLRAYVNLRRKLEGSDKVDYVLLNKAKKLLNPKDRLTLDFLFYTKDVFNYYLENTDNHETDIEKVLEGFIKIPIHEGEYFDGISVGDFSPEYGDLSRRDETSLIETGIYDDTVDFKLNIDFDK
ncbi:hypothetical protein MBAV_005184 [Candidatus Magnetobacterium bavaricum]|uniref:Uncharacterized protein n=1 Tax=Candidatus Magnetobacterium bavaricum TaxID=29290 RepID=A0A0F3GKX8_9BACT|nr:hypothetical protein MBAV_005184 [Candidatus Magnetobacterium bavaricum]